MINSPPTCHPGSVDDTDRAGDRDRIRLTFPAAAAYARLARIGAAGLAHLWGFGPSQVADLRLAVDEALILLFGAGDHPGTIRLDYSLDPEAMTIDIVAEFGDEESMFNNEPVERFRTLAGELVSEYELSVGRVRLQIERH